MLVDLTEEAKEKLEELQKEHDAYLNAKTGITRVQEEYQRETHSAHPDPRLQQLIDLADRRIAVTSALMLRIRTVGR